MSFPRLSANELGVWREDRPGRPFGILWPDIYRISGAKLDCIGTVDTTVELDWDYGYCLELNSTWYGFPDVILALTERMPGIDPDWFSQVEALGVDEPPLTVWRRDARSAG
jgi:hypothetical protein